MRWLAPPRRRRFAVVLVVGAALVATATCRSPMGADGEGGTVSRTRATRAEAAPAPDGKAGAAAEDRQAAAAPVQPAEPPASQPTLDGCTSVVRAPASLQDAIDAIADHTTPFVLCLDGTFVGGGAPPSEDRPGIGPYYGGVVVKGRSQFTLRGLSGAKIVGIVNDGVYPDPSAPPEKQGANDKANLLKVVDSDHVTLEWLDIDGRPPPSERLNGSTTLNRLVWFQHTTDSVLRYSRIQHAGGECVRIKANSQRNEVHHNEISDCGYFEFKLQPEERLRKNGEGIYVGTDPSQIAETQVNRQRYWGLDPGLVTDRSSFNHIHHNVLRPGPEGADWGNECVDLKEDWPTVRADLLGDAERGQPGHNLVADNDCAGQFDPESGAFDSRGPDNVFEHNRVSGTVKGAAVRIGAKEKSAGGAGSVGWQADGNVVRLNRLESFGFKSALKVFEDQPLALACGNVDAKGRSSFGGKFSNETSAATNRATCAEDDAPAGPRGAVGIPRLTD